MLGAVFVAIDARDNGARKEICIAWYFGILIFPPVVLVYVFMKMWKFKTFVDKEVKPATKKCGYCGATVSCMDKICPGCGRLF